MQAEVFEILTKIREELENEYSLPLHGKCIEASERISKALTSLKLKHKIVEGWVQYDDPHYGSNRNYDEHTWVEVEIDGVMIFLDVTMDQFQGGMDEQLPRIYMGTQPRFFYYEKPISEE